MSEQNKKTFFGICSPIKKGSGSDVIRTDAGYFRVMSICSDKGQAWKIIRPGWRLAKVELENGKASFQAWEE